MRARAYSSDEAPSELLAEIVRDQLENMILSGELKAGERLNENALATKLHVSRGPVREASRVLAEAGLIRIVRNRGAYVREISLEDALDLYDVRAGLARSCGRLAALRSRPEKVRDLERLWSEMERLRVKNDSNAYHAINRDFHIEIVKMAGNARLLDLHLSLDRELLLFTRRGVLGPQSLKLSSQEHRLIIDSISKGDQVKAAESFENHILFGKRRMLDSLSWKEDL